MTYTPLTEEQIENLLKWAAEFEIFTLAHDIETAVAEIRALRAGVEQWQENKAEVERLRKANAAQAKMLDDMEHTTKEYEALEAEVLRLRAETVPASEVAALSRKAHAGEAGAWDYESLRASLDALIAACYEAVRMVPVEALDGWDCVAADILTGAPEWLAMDIFIDKNAVTVMVRTEGKEAGDGEEH